MSTVIVVGSGVIGLSVCEALIQDGHGIILIDENVPGSQTSFGNAGLIADYANSPLANMDTLRKLPSLLSNKHSGVSLDIRDTHKLMHYGMKFVQAALSDNFARNQETLSKTLSLSLQAHIDQIDRLHLKDLVLENGCLHLYKNSPETEADLTEIVAQKKKFDIDCEFVSKETVHSLEPNVNLDGVTGGIFYPKTRSLLSPEKHAEALFRRLNLHSGFKYIDEAVLAFEQDGQSVWVKTNSQQIKGDELVLCAGIGTNQLLDTYGVQIPVVSERGYHIELDATELQINRPIGWQGKYFFATPMSDAIRLAGTTEFADRARKTRHQHHQLLEVWSKALFTQDAKTRSKWMGVRHSSPDGIPVISRLPSMQRVSVCFGHGHLGLTMAAFSGQFIKEMIRGNADKDLGKAYSLERF
ncbi:NAD(P)/FAD-dependent oxidoreductase [Photobacterium atrarenae]|uniref:FAD-binding oxidoreductase n=1 Tax=Photobacterium atrarenae TaxID=865757 RepID=A0ABY5GPY7_9GAMM|nr:FAD-dependent oxidoreductase [Photobacterium atrarenae]UTV30729.1 FAD-binding oxidoreductase [Photobacterium atrarenae]